MDALTDRILFSVTFSSVNKTARETGLSSYVVKQIVNGREYDLSDFRSSINSFYTRTAYQTLKSAPVPTFEASRYSVYSPATVTSIYAIMQERLKFYTIGNLNNILSGKGITDIKRNISKYYDEAEAGVLAGIQDSRKSLDYILEEYAK